MFLEQHNFKTKYSISDIFSLFNFNHKSRNTNPSFIVSIIDNKSMTLGHKRKVFKDTLGVHNTKLIDYLISVCEREYYVIVDVKFLQLNDFGNYVFHSNKYHFEDVKDSENFIRDINTLTVNFNRKINQNFSINGNDYNSNEHRLFIEKTIHLIDIIP